MGQEQDGAGSGVGDVGTRGTYPDSPDTNLIGDWTDLTID